MLIAKTAKTELMYLLMWYVLLHTATLICMVFFSCCRLNCVAKNLNINKNFNSVVCVSLK